MKSVSLLALSAAMLFCTAGISLAQVGSAGAGMGVNGSASGSSDGASAGVDAGADAGVSIGIDDDTNNDDSDDDAGTGGTAGGGTSGGTTGGIDLDSNGDGVVSEEEQAAAGEDGDNASPSGLDDCAAVDLSGAGMMGGSDITAIGAATSITVVGLTGCEGGAKLNSEIESALFGNEEIAAQLAREGVGGGEVLGVSASEGAITVYVAEGDSETGDDESSVSTDGSATGTSQ